MSKTRLKLETHLSYNRFWGPIQPSAQRITRSFPWVKRSGRDVDQSRPSTAEATHEWSFTFTPPFTFMKRKEQIYFFNFLVSSGRI